MSYDYDDDRDYLEEERPRDAKIDEAKQRLTAELFSADLEAVFYQRQIEVMFEDDYFHWITAKAMNELAQEQVFKTAQLPLQGNTHIRLYWHPSNRYWKRRANEIKKVILKFSESDVTHAIGRQGELMFDAALPRIGFMPRGQNVKTYNGRIWTKTKHDLDRVFEADGIAYGVEIKNTLSYIERNEMTTKIEMCKHLGLRPLFIMRMAPRSYINDIRINGGFSLIFQKQLYPFGYNKLAAEVSRELGLRVECVKDVADGHIQRLKRWHDGLVLAQAKRKKT